MSKLTAVFLGMMLFTACNNATDGDANTDTTNIVTDTNRYSNPTDSVDHINTNSGTLIDSAATDKTGGEGASKKTPASSRKTTPHNPARIDTLKQ